MTTPKFVDLTVEVQVALINAAKDVAVAKITAKVWKFDNYVQTRYWFEEALKETVDAYKKECKS